MLRTILAVLYVVLFLILGLISGACFWLIGKFDPALADRLYMKRVRLGFRIITFIAGVRLTVEGKENLIPDKAVLYAANHRSYFDVILSYPLFPAVTGYVAKIEFLKIPLLNFWMKKIHCIFLNRSNLRESLRTIKKGIEDIKNGISLCIFPEGTRTKTDDQLDMLPFKEGSMSLAEKSGCPVIPMAILNARDVWEKQFPRIKRVNVYIRFGKPIDLSKLPKEQRKASGAYVRNIIHDMLVDMQNTCGK